MLALLLAGGRSQRARGHKACRRFQGRSWLAWQCHALRAAGFRQIRVVLGRQPGRAVRCLPQGYKRRWNPGARTGPFSSLQTGLRGQPQPTLLLPLDVPLPDRTTLYHLARAGRRQPAALPIRRGRGGHPVMLGKSLVRRLQELNPADPASRLDWQLRLSGAARTPTRNPFVGMNLNRQRDWRAFLRARAAAPRP